MTHPLNFVLIGVRQHGQETRAFDGCVQLALINGPCACQAGWNDFSIFSNEIAQGIDVFVIDLFNASDGEPTKSFALKKQRLGVALWALVFVEFFESCHEGLLGNNLKRMNVKND